MTVNTSNPRQVVGKRRQHHHAQERGNQRRKLLIDAAMDLLQETPIEQLSFKRVSDKAGVPEGSAYHFFANRFDLLAAVANTLAGDFAQAYSKPFPIDATDTWQDLADLMVERAVDMYRNSRVASQIWLSGRTPAQVRLADHVTDRAVSGFLFSIFDSVFVMPEFPTDSDPFFFFLELCDVPLSISVIEHGEIKDEMVDEAKRVGRGYLSTYLPTVLKKRPLE
jgi:AcrR family transcriptional regulator